MNPDPTRVNDELILTTLRQLCDNDAQITQTLAGFAAVLSARLPTLQPHEKSLFQEHSSRLEALAKKQSEQTEKIATALQTYRVAKAKIRD